MIKAIIFDCFGVLAEDGWSPFKRKYLTDNPELLQKVSQLGRDVDAGERSYDDMIRDTARIIGVDEAEVRKAVERKVPNEPLFVYIRDELKPKYKIGMLSNASYNVLEHLFSSEHTELFDATALSYELGMVKPDTEMYRTAAERLGVAAEDCLLVDDKQGHAEGAKKAGMQAVVYTDTDQLKRDLGALLQ